MILMVQKAVLLAVCLIISGGVLASSASTFVAPWSSYWALKLNPFNSNARIQWLGESTFAEGADLPDLLEKAVMGYRLAPSDARMLSVAGVIKEKSGQPDEARTYYTTVLKTMPSEIKALSRSLIFALTEGDYQEAAQHINIIGKRWVSSWHRVETLLPLIMNDEVAFRAIADGLGSTERGRGLLSQSLKSVESQALAYELLIYWDSKGVPGLRPLVAKVAKAIYDQGDVNTAYFLFRQTLPDDLANQGNYVFNGDFSFEPSGNPFDWTITQQPGVGIQRTRAIATGSQSGHEVQLRFRNAPVKLENLYQSTRLGPGKYQFSVTHRTDRLVAGKPIRFIIECRKKGTELASLDVSKQAEQGITQSTQFEIADDSCPNSRLVIRNQAIRSSWKDRYNGMLAISSVKVSYLGAL